MIVYHGDNSVALPVDRAVIKTEADRDKDKVGERHGEIKRQ